MLFMVIERFKNRDARPVYARVAERGRLLPDGVAYLGSWIEPTFERCFQVMECDDEKQLHPWMDAWRDLVDFEVIPVVTSMEARALAAG